MMNRRLLATVLAVLALSACAGTGAGGTKAGDSAAAQDDLQAVNRFRDTFTATFKSGDPTALAALYTADGMSQPNMQPTTTGTDGIAAGYKGLFDAYTIADIAINGTKTEVSGNLAYDIGTYHFTAVPKAKGDTMKAEGRYVVVLRKGPDGAWKLVTDIDNVTAPMSPPPAPAKK